MQEEDTKSKVVSHSIWLIPPPPHSTQISKLIEKLAHLNDSPTFTPHVTVVGNLKILDGEETTILEELKSAFIRFDRGGIPCTFNRSRGFVTMYNLNNQIVWNQACVGVVERNENLLKAVELTKKCLLESKHVIGSVEKSQPTADFSPPLKEPHLSFIYKESAINFLDEMELPEDFVSTQMVLVRTDPCSFEHISSWKVVGSINF